MAEALAELLKGENYDADVFYEGLSGLNAALSGIYDLLILDVMMPGINGFEVASRARKAGIKVPILMLTAKSELDDKVRGLDCGADDYLTKPFETRELLARVRALLRRNYIDQTDENGNLKFGDLSLDAGASVIENTENSQSVRLSEKELHILEMLMQSRGRIISKEQLAVKIWGYENEAEYNNVEVYISFTRKKLHFINSKVEIKAVRGLGYEFREN